jgi:8-oxo-dGTP diphosphatase
VYLTPARGLAVEFRESARPRYTALMQYSYEYPRPGFTVDTIVFAGPRDSGRKVLLVKRCTEPFKGWWALPGGFVDEGERPVEAARRELAEETGLVWEGPMVPVGTFGDPDRDPRGWTVSAAYLADVGLDTPIVVGPEEECEAQWHFVDELPELAFDHDEMIAAAIWRLGELLP